jgi:hypothetical protein
VVKLASFLVTEATLDPHCPIEFQHFQAAITVDILNLLSAAVDREVIQRLRLNPKHRLEGCGGNAAEARPLFIDLALACGLIKVDAPTIFPDHPEIDRKLIGGEVGVQIGAIGGVELAASPTVLNTLPSCHAACFPLTKIFGDD